MRVKKLAVLGLGTMGRGIAQVGLQAGMDVVGFDVDDARNAAALASITRALDSLVERGKLALEDRNDALGRLQLSVDHAPIADCDAVIEAIPEDEDAKKALFATLSEVASPDALLISNTSSLSITGLAASVAKPERFVGMHFFNPVPRMRLIEVVRALQSDEANVERARALGRALGKEVVVAKDTVAFIVNRALLPFLNEAIFELDEGVSSATEIDQAIKLGLNHPMGPLELCDLVGLDTLLSVLDALHRRMGDSKYRPSPLLRLHVEAGWLGRKTGRGFHDYSGS